MPKARTRTGLELDLEEPSVVFAADISEKDFSQMIVDLAEGLGWKVFRTWSSRHSPAGEPDLRMVHPRQKRIIWAEVKQPGGRLTPAQTAALAILRAADAEVYTWWPKNWEEIVGILDWQE